MEQNCYEIKKTKQYLFTIYSTARKLGQLRNLQLGVSGYLINIIHLFISLVIFGNIIYLWG